MKIKTSLLINVLIVCFFVFVIVQWGTFYFSITGKTVSFSSTGISYTATDTLQPINTYVSEQLPYNQYKKIKDSLETIRNLKNGIPTGNASHLVIIGTATLQRCDTCSIYALSNNELKEAHQENFIRLLWWKLQANQYLLRYSNDRFHVENGQSYLRKLVPAASSPQHFFTIDQPVPFRYDSEFDCILIPISKSMKQVLDVLFVIISIGMFGYFAFMVIGNFLSLLIDLSKGEVFTNLNLKRIKAIAWTLAIYLAVFFLSNLSFRFIFDSYFTDDIVLSEKSWQGWKLAVICLIAFLIYNAFKQGKKIKEEQELTI